MRRPCHPAKPTATDSARRRSIAGAADFARAFATWVDGVLLLRHCRRGLRVRLLARGLRRCCVGGRLLNRRRRRVGDRRWRLVARRRWQRSRLRGDVIRRTTFEHRTHRIESFAGPFDQGMLRVADERGRAEGRDRSDEWHEHRCSPKCASWRSDTRGAVHRRHRSRDDHARCDAHWLDSAHRRCDTRQRRDRRRSVIGRDVAGERPAAVKRCRRDRLQLFAPR